MTPSLVRLLLLTALLACVAAPVSGQDDAEPLRFPQFRGDFHRVTERDGVVDTLAGQFYLFADGQAHFEITEPVRQVMRVRDSVLTIFYPETNRGFYIVGQAPMEIPLLPSLLAATRPDYGPGTMGYRLAAQALRGDTLVTTWRPPDNVLAMDWFELERRGGQIVRATYFIDAETALLVTEFGPAEEVGPFQVPLTIRTTNPNPDMAFREDLTFSNVEHDPTFPDAIARFELPADARMRTRSF